MSARRAIRYVTLCCLAFVLEVLACAAASEPAAGRSSEASGESAPQPASEEAAPPLDDGALPQELVILGGGKDVSTLVEEIGGEITFSVEETNTHQAKFSVKNAAELRGIAEKLRARGVQVMRAHVFRPQVPGDSN